MDTTFEIRPALAKDVPIIFQFIKELAKHGGLSTDLLTSEEILTETLFGNKVYAEVILGCIQQKPVSYALFSYHFSTLFGRPSLYLVDLFVTPDVRHQGIGHAMMVHLAKLAKSENCCRFEWSVLDWNKSAIDFYNQIGAKEMAEWRIYRMQGSALEELAGEDMGTVIKRVKNYG